MPDDGKLLIWAYQTNVKPAIEKRLFDIAYSSMSTANGLLMSNQPAVLVIMRDIHCGNAFLGSALSLEEALQSEDLTRISDAQKEFEAYSAQTRLPKY